MNEVILISAIMAVVAAAVVCIVVVKRYKGGLFSPIYPLEHYTRLELTEHSDRFLNRHVTRVKIQSSDNKKK